MVAEDSMPLGISRNSEIGEACCLVGYFLLWFK